MTQDYKRAIKNTKVKRLASLRSAREGSKDAWRNPGSNFYVVDKLLYNAHEAGPDDLIRVQKMTGSNCTVYLKPVIGKEYVVSYKDFKRDYKIV